MTQGGAWTGPGALGWHSFGDCEGSDTLVEDVWLASGSGQDSRGGGRPRGGGLALVRIWSGRLMAARRACLRGGMATWPWG